MQRFGDGLCALMVASGVLLGACSRSTPGNGLAPAWPASLRPVGDGYPVDGAPCRRVGESEATIDFLDDSATLVGCPDGTDVTNLGGKTLTTIDGITLVSIPAGDASGGNDALVEGTSYHATASVRCDGVRGQTGPRCPAGVKRRAKNGLTVVEVSLPDGGLRSLYFGESCEFAGADSPRPGDPTAPAPKALRRDDTTVVILGGESYEIPDVFVIGD
jgi:hypothetical protein